MILVINLNASVDKRYKMKDLIKVEVMRAAEVDNTPGGKGIFYWNIWMCSRWLATSPCQPSSTR